MRKLTRPALPKAAQTYLSQSQAAIDVDPTLLEQRWKSARQTKAFHTVIKTLRGMAGSTERCMYCVDSHGCDVEHFRPKQRYTQHAFDWLNFLLCCTECGRFKGDRFPTENGHPLLIDPSIDDPWEHLDFDPDTGNLTARFDLAKKGWSAKGEKTVELLQFDRREALSKVYQTTFRRLSNLVQAALNTSSFDSKELLAALQAADDHGLLPWCFGPTGQSIAPFSALHAHQPELWESYQTAAK
jgi:uncharacterized protein (TIGR02646 family)